MRPSTHPAWHRVTARLILIALLNQWLTPQAFASPHQATEESAPLPLASTVTAVSTSQTTTFTDTTLIGKDATEIVGKWIRVFTEDQPAGQIIQVTAFDSETGQITLHDPLPAGAVDVNDVYHLADSRDVLLPTNVDPASIGFGSIGCTPTGTNQVDTITCFAIDATGVNAQKGDDTVAVTSPTIVLVTKFGSDKKNDDNKEKKSEEKESESPKEVKAEVTAIDLGEGNDRIVNDGTVVSAAISLASETPKAPSDNTKAKKEDEKEDPKVAATVESTATGIDGGAGQNTITSNGTISTSATALVLARQIPGESGEAGDAKTKQQNSDVSSSATATNSAIQSGDDGSFITNTGRLASRAIAVAAGVGMTTSANEPPSAALVGEKKEEEKEATANNFTFKGDVQAQATSSGITTGSGNDTVTNTGDIIVTAAAVTLDAGAAQIQAKGNATTTAKAESTSTATGVAAGDGNDSIINTGTLMSNATSRAISIEIAIADKKPASASDKDTATKKEGEKPEELSSTTDGSATATAQATGISADAGTATPESDPIFKLGAGNLTVGRETTETRAGGNDSVNNSGTIDVNATARAVSGSGAITIDGSATAKPTSTATARTTAIDLGAGNDTLNNSGTITSVADAMATAIGIAVAQKAASGSTTPPGEGTPPSTAQEGEKNTIAIKAAVEGSATATSTATGVSADGALSTTNDQWEATARLSKEFEFTRETMTTQATGADVVTNSGVINTLATSTTRAASVGISADGAATIRATSTANSTASGVDLGAGNDTLTNTADGDLVTNATATATALSLAIGFKSDEKAKADVKAAAAVTTQATARATGVSADGVQTDTSQSIKLGVSLSQLSLDVTQETRLGTGNDVVTNNGSIAATATASSNALGIAVGVNGKATVDASSAAQAESSAIDLGRGNDTVTNTGTVSAVANATANALGISVGIQSGTDPPTAPPSDGGTEAAAKKPPTTDPPAPTALDSTASVSAFATATAVGVSADSVSAEVTRHLQLQIGGGPTFLTVGETTTRPGGSDTVTNSGTIDVTAGATSGALAASVATDGKAAVDLKSTADASAAGIDLGGGNDSLNNTGGTVTATATAVANALSAALGMKSDQQAKSTAESVVEASVKAEARAAGIATDALRPDTTVNLTIQHLEGVLSISGQGSSTRPSGDDTVSNAADVTSTATATSRQLAAAIALDGNATAKPSSTATAEASGIDLGAGNDTVTSNTGDLTVTATATAQALGIALGVQTSSGGSGTPAPGGTEAAAAGETPKPTAAATKASVDGSVEASATAIGLAADSVRADSAAAGSLSLPGLRPQMHIEASETRTGGDDTVTNDGAITTTATSFSRAIGAGAAVGGDVTIKTASTANAAAAGIDLGGGNDTLTNNGEVKATSSATAEAMNVSLVAKSESSSESKPQRATSSVDANATAGARAIGLAADSTQGDRLFKLDLTIGDSLSQGAVFGFLNSETRASGNDNITNTGNVDANAFATTVAAGLGLNAEGIAKAWTTSTAEASSAAIDLGAGADSVTNEGTLKSFATAIAAGLTGAITNKRRAGAFQEIFAASEGLWKGGIEASATAMGIDGSGAADKSTSLNVELSGDIGVDARFEKREDGITADLADTITNQGNLEVAATALAGSVNVSVTAEGLARAVSDVESNALAAGVRGGQGDDTIDNLGFNRITFVTANALTGGATVAVSGKGRAVSADTLWSTGTNAEAAAVGLDGDGGIFKLKSIVFLGTQLNIDKIEAGGIGNDTITNEQVITSVATATAPSLGVSYSAQEGVAASLSSVETTAAATGIRGGGGNDFILNLGMLFVGASSLSVAANIAIAKDRGAAAGGAIWDGGTKAESTAIGIDADGVSTATKKTTVTVSENGVSIVHEKKDDTVAGAGNDTVLNVAAITVGARAESDTLAVAGGTKGVSASFGQSTTEATAAAIRGGAGDDTLTNHGDLGAIATSIARAVNVSVETTGGVAIAGNGVWDGGTTAESRATGIAGDGGSTKTKTTTISIGGGDLINVVKTDVAATGNDTITNTAKIDVLADSSAPAASVAVPVKGLGLAISTTTAEATAAAIDAGAGDDVITNRGELKSTATATAATANVAVTNTGVAIAADAVWKGGTTATATAKGIDTGDGQSTVTNTGAIEADATSTALSGSVAVAITGVAAATATSTSTAHATGIALGHSDTFEAMDTLTNTGALTVNALALAAAASVSVTNLGLAVSADSVWDGGTKATAIAKGIGDTGGPETVLNGGRIEVGATAATGSATVSVAVTGVAAAIGTATGHANASAIDLGDGGADLLINRGRLIVDAIALAGTVDVAVTTAGVAGAGNDVWNGGTTAEAVIRAINTGNGDDVITNAGDVNADSDATTVAVPVSVAVSGVGIAIGTSTAISSATAIDGGDGNNTIVNRNAGIEERTGKLVADATAHAVTASVAVTTAGIAGASDAVWDGGTKADAIARGLKTSFGGNDTIDNGGAIDATSTARSGSASVGVAVTGVAIALANSTATSNAAAIDTGAPPDDAHNVGPDNDTVANRGALTVNSNAFALSVPVAVTAAGLAVAGNSVWNGGTTADAKAAGIATRAGDDVIGNSAAITADADATSGSIGVSVAVTGVAAAIATSTAKAEASAIDAGAGADRITNTGKLSGDTKALSGTVTVGVTTAGVAVAGDAVWDGGTKAEATTKTLSAGDGDDKVRNVGDVSAVSVADTASVAVSVAVAGVGASVATSTATSTATAIDLGAGDDTVVNMSGGQTDRTGKLTANATANAIAANVSVAPAGVAIASDAIWRGGTTATAAAAGIDGGLGKDVVVNSSEMDIDAKSFTHSLSAAVTVFGVSAALVNSTTNVSGGGIKTGDNVRTDAGDPIDMDLITEQDVVFNMGRLVVDVEAFATSLGIGFSFGGMAAAADNLWDGGTTSNAWAYGIGVGNGADELTNAGDVDISSLARALSASFGVTVFGVSAAASTATANARSSALDGGDGNDTVTNLAGATLTSDAAAIGRGTSVSFVGIGATVAGDTVWNGGTTGDALAKGIDGGLGNDTLTNEGTIVATGDSTTSSVSIAITGIGVGAAAATSNSTGAARAIDGGDGIDVITSRGNATATAIANATGVAVQATGIGAGAAFDSFNGGTQATANATGLAGGAGDDTVTLADQKVTAGATSEAHSTSVSVTLVGVAGGAAASTSTATATGIDGGTGVDTITTNSELLSTANATATGNTIVVSTLGSVAGAFDSATRAESNAVGVAGGDGNDTITATDKAKTTLTSNAGTTATSVTVEIAGFSLSDTQAVATARATGIAGDAGNDTVTHDGVMTGTLSAESKARGVVVNVVGPLTTADTSSRAEIIGTAIDGGADSDGIENRSQITLTGTSIARGTTVSVTGGAGNANAASTSTASLTGLQGGDGTDDVTNAVGGVIGLDATAQTITSSRSISLTVNGTSNTQATPTATVTGLDGGAGDDSVVNNATVTANAHAFSSSTSSSINLIGKASTTAGTLATANVTGLYGGLGTDTVHNRALVTVNGLSEATVSSSSWSLAGSAANSALFSATGLATGMGGGAGVDVLWNEGFLTVGFASSLSATGGSTAIFGGASASTNLTAGGGAVGIAGDADDDAIQNDGTIDLDATANVTATKATVSFAAGTPAIDALLTSNAIGTGLAGGSGNNWIRNFGDISVLAAGTSTVTGGAEATIIGSPRTGGLSTANATATGIRSDDGVNDIANDGVLDVIARGDTVTTNSSTSGLIFSDSTAVAGSRSLVDAFGISSGAGNGFISSANKLFVTADASGYSNAYASGSHIAIKGAATTRAETLARGTAVGIRTLGGANTIFNDGLLSVLAQAGTSKNITRTDSFCLGKIIETVEVQQEDENGNPIFDEMGNPVMTTITTERPDCTESEVTVSSSPTYAAANGNGVDGEGRATAVGTAEAFAFGVQAGNGANVIANLSLGDVNVTAHPTARTVAFADGDALAEAFGTSTAISKATAIGIQAGTGNNQIFNFGNLTVLAKPGAIAKVDVTTAEEVCVFFFFGTWCTPDGGIGTATANATMNATAVGIQVGGGNNLIVNDGLLSVTAAPNADDPFTENVVEDDPTTVVHFDVRNRSTTVVASAIGIQTGNGNNTIVNGQSGVINVTANYTAGCLGNCSKTVTATGILTGTGHDTIENHGTITLSATGVAMNTAIDAGAGNDRVVLGSDSHTNGNVLLGSGDDRLVWEADASITGTVNPGSGVNLFALGGSRNSMLNVSASGPIGGMNVFTAFSGFRKEGSSTWTLTGHREIDWIVEDGALVIDGQIVGTVTTEAAAGGIPIVALTQSGVLGSQGSAPTIQLSANSLFLNQGLLTASSDGAAVQTRGADAAILNEGTIIGGTSAAVLVTGNENALVNRGEIQGLTVAVATGGGSGNVVLNDGTITAAGVGVTLGAGDVLANAGTIAGTTSFGIHAGEGTQYVSNSGVINGGGGVAVDLGAGDDQLTIFGSSQMDGVARGGEGTDKLILGGTSGVLDLSTFGRQFDGFESTVVEASRWTLTGTGALDLSVDRGLVDVAGQVHGTLQTGDAPGNALIFVGSTGSVTAQDEKPAVVVQGSNMLVNAGVIDGKVAAIGADSMVLNVGVIENRDGIAVRGGDGSQRVENDGLIISSTGTAIDLGAGDDFLQLTTDARIKGNVLGGTGLDTVALNGNGVVRLDLGAFDGFENLHKEGNGLWMLTGSSNMGLGAFSGTLVLNGSLTGQASTQPGALLAGNGQVGSFTNAGIVSPGMSLGSIKVAGDFTQTSTGVLQIEGSIFSDVSDRLTVSGAASLGGTLELLPELRSFGIATEYTILEAQGGVTGTFASTSSTNSSLDTYVDYLPQSVAVAFVRNDISFAGMGNTANLQALGQSLDASKRSMARGDFKAVMDEFLAMDAPAQTAALTSISGELHASLPTTLLRTGERFLSASATRRLNAEQRDGERMTLWTDYLRFNGNVTGSAGTAGATYGASGLVGGADFAIGSRARLGGSFGYANGTSELALGAGDSARVRSRMPAVYGEYGLGRVLVEGAFGYAEHAVRTARQIVVGTIRRQALADYVADQYSGSVRVSLDVPVNRALAFAPFFEARESQVTRRAFDETGADSVNLSGDAFTTTSLRTLVGMRAAFGTPHGLRRESSRALFGTRLEPTLSLAWTRDGQERRSGMSAVLSGMTSRSGYSGFTLNGVSDSRDGVLIDAGTSLAIANHGRAFVAYDGLLTDLRTEHSFAAGMRIVW